MIKYNMIGDKLGNMKQPEDELISKRQLVMLLSNMQMGTNPHTEEGNFEWNVLEEVRSYVMEMRGVPINRRSEEDADGQKAIPKELGRDCTKNKR